MKADEKSVKYVVFLIVISLDMVLFQKLILLVYFNGKYCLQHEIIHTCRQNIKPIVINQQTDSH